LARTALNLKYKIKTTIHQCVSANKVKPVPAVKSSTIGTDPLAISRGQTYRGANPGTPVISCKSQLPSTEHRNKTRQFHNLPISIKVT
jgi:SRSO17 transposase